MTRNMHKTVVGLVGLGTVGTGVVRLLRNHPSFDIRAIAVRDLTRARDIDTETIRMTDNPFLLAADPEIHVLIEVAGGVDPAGDVIRQAIKSGKHIITANKELISKHGPELFALARAHNVTIFFEAAVAGGIPLISTLQRGLLANRFSRVAGILNGTTNYILTRMEQDKQPFAAALAEAQAKGYAEADPTNDVEGHDVAYKISILASLAFQRPVEAAHIYRQGITRITDLDIQLAAEFGYRIKMIGLAQPGDGERLDVRVHPMLVPLTHSLAGIAGVNNAIFISGDAVGQVTLSGPGAGQMPTASAVVGDLINLASAQQLPDFAAYFQPRISTDIAPITPIAETNNAFYIRFESIDTPGVIGALGTAFGKQGVSLHSITQKGVTADGSATIVILTHSVRESQAQAALDEIRALPSIRQVALVLRVLA
ncbi:MAG: homoserine dehydrogenase [Blastocatellia bacterium]